MQVKYETQLIEPLTIKPDDFGGQASKSSRQTLDTYTIEPPVLNPITYVTCNPVANLAAIYLSKSQQIVLIDTKTYLKRERFPLKSCDKKFSKLSFTLKGLDFSPDGLKLAVGQSDCIIYIYKLPTSIVYQNINQLEQTSSSSKPTISGKFVCSSPVTCLLWTEFGIVFGTQDGKVKLVLITSGGRLGLEGQPSANAGQPLPVTNSPAQTTSSSSSSVSQPSNSTSSSKVISLYNPPKSPSTAPLSLAAKYPIVAVGYLDSSIQVISMATSGGGEFATSAEAAGSNLDTNRRSSSQATPIVSSTIQHSCPPSQLAILNNNVLCCAGSDGRLVLHSIHSGNLISWLQNIELKEDILAIDYSNINEILVIATTNKLLFMKHEPELNSWQLQASFIEISQIFSLSSVKWLKDGSQLIVGTSNGSLELFQCSWNNKQQATTLTGAEQLDICHIAKNRVRITDRSRNLLATYKSQYDIKRVNLLNSGRSVIIWTTNSLLLANMMMTFPSLQSEITWQTRDKSAKFSFKHPGYVLIFNNNTRELSIVKLGQDFLSYSVKFQLDESSPLRKSTICVHQYPSILALVINQQQQVGQTSPTTQTRQRSPGSLASRSRQASLVPTSGGEPASLTSPPEQQSQQQLKSLLESAGSVRERLAYVSEGNFLLTIVDLKTKSKEFTLKHNSPIELVTFCNTGNYLLFTAQNKELYLINLKERKAGEFVKQLLLENCLFASWLPGTDILIGQSKEIVSIWYNIEDLNDISQVDTRSCNIIKSVPILDLSLISSERKDNNSRKRLPYPTIRRVLNYGIILTNKQTIPLDKTKVKFYVEINEQKLESAFEVLTGSRASKDCPEKLRRILLNKLGWYAINKSNCELAIKVFRELDYNSMVRCLERCQESDEPEEREWRLAMLKGDWETFEQIADSEHIITTYKRLNKWSRLIEYLNKTQQFRQRDLAEEEYRKWLIERGRFLEAAESLIKASDLAGALELLIENEKFLEALELFTRELKGPLQQTNLDSSRRTFHLDDRLLELARRMKEKFLELEQFERAAKISHKILNQQEEALELYLRAEKFEDALELARSNNSLFGKEKLSEIEKNYANHLIEAFKGQKISRKKTLPAIGHLLAASLPFEALSLAIDLGDFQKAFEIIQSERSFAELKEDEEKALKIREFCNLIGEFMLKKNNFNEAIETYLICKNYDLVIRLCIDQANYEKAFEVASRYLYEGEQEKTNERFVQLARELADEKAYEKAEKIYLMVNKHELAIEMHKAAANHDRMLALIEQFQPDFLESNLLLLARQLESEGNFQEAERYLLRASESEWTNVVRMYRLANRWEEAFRVAKAHCSSPKDPLLVQLAFWWSKSLVSGQQNNLEESRKLLKELGLFKSVVEFCCDNKNFQFAIDLCAEPEMEAKQAEVVKRFASFLEESQKFKLAEELLTKHQQYETAIEMYIDNELYSEAIQVVEGLLASASKSPAEETTSASSNGQQKKKLVDLLNGTLIKCANRIVEQVKPQNNLRQQQQLLQSTNGLTLPAGGLEKLQRARQLFLRAQRPDLAVELYKERGMWQEAIQVAQRFAPQLLEGVESALEAQVLSDVEPILAEVSASKARSSASSSSRASLMSSQSGGGGRVQSSSTEIKSTNPLINKPELRSFKQLASNLMHNQAERSMRNGLDARETKLALSKFMDTLIDGQGHLIEARQVKLKSWLSELNRLVASESSLGEEELLTISDRIISHASWGWLSTSGGANNDNGAKFYVWRELRELLASCSRKYVNSEQFLRRLLISHFASLHACLLEQLYYVINLDSDSSNKFARHSGASGRNKSSRLPLPPSSFCWPSSLSVTEADRLRRQLSASGSRRELASELLNLIAKLSLSLLRYVDLLEARKAFHVAGFWLLAGGRLQLARFVWIRLMELTADAEDGKEESGSRVQFELERAGIPWQDSRRPVEEGNNQQEHDNQLSGPIIGEIRQWLVGALIETSSTSGRRVSLDERGQIESSLVGVPPDRKSLSACLVSGYPVLPARDQLVLGSGGLSSQLNQVRKSDWNRLLSIGRRLEQLRGSSSNQIGRVAMASGKSRAGEQSTLGVNGEIDFIIRLSGADRSLLRDSL